MLKISEDLSLPINAVTQKMAFLGRTGSGKTYAATKVAEEMLGAGAQVVALDPVGVWHGLRIAADGKGDGIKIPVFGGLHGDVPIEHTGGKLIADIIVDRALSAIIDVSQFESDSRKAQFAAEFANRLFFRKKAAPSPVMLFLEECQEFIPQNPDREEAKMLHDYTRLTKLGRNFGIGLAMISQRPQEVNKKCLNLTECMFAFQMTGPHERKTIRSWVEEKGADLDIVDALPKFQVGECHVWSPQWLQISKTVKIAKKWTFNSSSTPAFGSSKKIEPKPLDSSEMERLRKEMSETIERAKADDPRELRREIAELKKQASLKPTVAPAEAGKEFERGVSAERKRIGEVVGKLLRVAQSHLDKVLPMEVSVKTPGFNYEKTVGSEALEALAGAVAAISKEAPIPLLKSVPMPPARVSIPGIPKRSESYGKTSTNGDLSGPEQRIIDAIAWMESIGIAEPELTAVAFLAGYTIGGGGFNNPKGSLNTKGMVRYVPGGKIALSEGGRPHATFPDTVLTAEELHRKVMDRLPGPESKILKTLIDAYPSAMSNEECASQSGYTLGGGGYNNPRGRLRTRGLVEYPGPGTVRARDLLFLK